MNTASNINVHIAFADDASGVTNFTTGAAGGRQFVGVYADGVVAPSPDPAAYSWSRIGTLNQQSSTEPTIDELLIQRALLVAAIADLEARIAAGDNGPGLRYALLVMKRQLASVGAQLRDLGVEV